jgi:hypothetical protein
MLLNVVVAVLLVPIHLHIYIHICIHILTQTYTYTYTYTQDEFISSVTHEKEAEEQEICAEQEKRKLRHRFSKYSEWLYIANIPGTDL